MSYNEKKERKKNHVTKYVYHCTKEAPADPCDPECRRKWVWKTDDWWIAERWALNLRDALTQLVLLHSCSSHMAPDSVE